MVSGRLEEAWRRHERRWKDHRFVYAVVSRRSRGISVGINLSPEKACNFNCVYCQVDRRSPFDAAPVDPASIEEELDHILSAERNGALYDDAPFDALPPAERGARDIAFSGDGEPTAYPGFAEVARIAAEARRRHGLRDTKLVLITNASYLDKPSVRSALALMDEGGGEVWAKLDAGTEAYFRKVNRADVPLDRILENISDAARRRPVVIQSLWARLRGEAPPEEEIESYLGRLGDILDAGGRLKAIQLHTVMRHPAESHVAPLTRAELERIADSAGSRLPVPVEVFG